MDWAVLWTYRVALLEGAATTVGLSAAVMVLATAVGVAAGLLAGSGSFLPRKLVELYTELLRNLPLLVKLFFLYFVAGLPAVAAAVLALVLHQSAYIADVTRAGLRTVGSGQFDAAGALGLPRWATYRLVVLPQTLRAMLPPMTSQYVAIVKNSSVVALLGIADLTFQTQQINVETFRGFEAATAVTVMYAALAGLVIAGMGRLERRARR